MTKKDFNGKKVLVCGLARSGLQAAFALKRLGALVYVSDSGQSPEIKRNLKQLISVKAIKAYQLGAHTRDFFKGNDLVIMSPGIPLYAKPYAFAKALKIKIISEIELGSVCAASKIIAVTGSNGKSTTASLIGHILKTAGKRPIVCGNIGRAFCEFASSAKPSQPIVLEVSSAQLEGIDTFKPHVSVMLNVTRNHFDRYKNLKEYAAAKQMIFKNQDKSCWAIINHDDKIAASMAKYSNAKCLFFSLKKKVKGAYLSGDDLILDVDGSRSAVCKIQDIKLRGLHNYYNCLAAVLAAYALGVEKKYVINGLRTFTGLSHRIEFIAKIDGVEFFNDSKSTSTDATICALDALKENVILIAGGRDKGNDFSLIRGPVRDRVKRAILIGESRQKIANSIKDLVPVDFAGDLKEAILIARDHAGESDKVLLSPMCASFDMFNNFEHRGDAFKELVGKLCAR